MLLSDVCQLVQVAPSGECLRGEGQVYLTGLLVTYLYLAAYSPVLNLMRTNTRLGDRVSRSRVWEFGTVYPPQCSSL